MSYSKCKRGGLSKYNEECLPERCWVQGLSECAWNLKCLDVRVVFRGCSGPRLSEASPGCNSISPLRPCPQGQNAECQIAHNNVCHPSTSSSLTIIHHQKSASIPKCLVQRLSWMLCWPRRQGRGASGRRRSRSERS